MKRPRSFIVYASTKRTHRHQDAVSVRTKKGKRVDQVLFVRVVASKLDDLAALSEAECVRVSNNSPSPHCFSMSDEILLNTMPAKKGKA
jgi:hypothetical protein